MPIATRKRAKRAPDKRQAAPPRGSRATSAAVAALMSAQQALVAPTMPDPEALMAQPRVCAMLDVTDRTLERWRKNPRLRFPPAIKLGTHRNFYRRADIVAWAAQRAAAPALPAE
jgi:predicted DNA-binding transcriptional regulator AlpA